MPETIAIPYTQSTDLVTYTVLIEGEEISSSYQVMSLMVSKEVNRIASASIVLLDGEPAAQDFVVSNQETFIPGNEIEITAGYHSDNETIFKGIIIRHNIKIKRGGSFLVLDCRDKTVKMTVGRKSKYFAEMSDSDVADELISPYGLESELEATSVTHQALVQFDATDWDFIISRLESNGQIVVVDDGRIISKKPNVEDTPLFDLTYGDNIYDFDAEMDSRNQVNAVKGIAWSHSDQALLEADGSEPEITEEGNLSAADLNAVINLEELKLQHTAQLSQDELQAWADAQLLKNRMSKIRGRVRFTGFAGVKPGDTVRLNGLGERFNGLVFVSAIRHEIAEGTWMTNLQFGLSAEWFAQRYPVNHLPAASLLPAIQGLHIGLVTDLEDPDGEFRVKVKLPVISNEDEGIWARFLTLDAGNNRGTVFRPEVSDEVLVGFLNNDPRHPVILGMLHSSAHSSPIAASNSNNEKGYTSRSGIKFLFDDEKKSVSIETPGGNQVILNDEDGVIQMKDQNDNKITMDADGIKIESAKDIVLTATADIKQEGVNVSMKASAGLKAEGDGTTEIKSSGTLTVKGSLIQIN